MNNNSNKKIISFIGNFASGKSSIIKELVKVIPENNPTIISIDEVRKKLWEDAGKGEWDQSDEDKTYKYISDRILESNFLILETTGLALRIQRMHRLLSSMYDLRVIKITCETTTSIKRQNERNKDKTKYPPLQVLDDIDQGIVNLSDMVNFLPADLTLDSENTSPEINAKKAFNFIEQPSQNKICLLYTSPSPRDQRGSRMPSSA